MTTPTWQLLAQLDRIHELQQRRAAVSTGDGDERHSDVEEQSSPAAPAEWPST